MQTKSFLKILLLPVDFENSTLWTCLTRRARSHFASREAGHLSYFILALCLGKHSCMSPHFLLPYWMILVFSRGEIVFALTEVSSIKTKINQSGICIFTGASQYLLLVSQGHLSATQNYIHTTYPTKSRSTSHPLTACFNHQSSSSNALLTHSLHTIATLWYILLSNSLSIPAYLCTSYSSFCSWISAHSLFFSQHFIPWGAGWIIGEGSGLLGNSSTAS